MSKNSTINWPEDGLLLSGYHRKLKTMKKKFFVLYKETLYNAARLEYYDSEKKFKSGLSAKRDIILRNCFNINRRYDTKHDYVIALSTKDGGFGIVFDDQNEMVKWLEILVSLHEGGDISQKFEHVWQVNIQKRGLAEEKGLVGNFHICLSTRTIKLVRIRNDRINIDDNALTEVEFQLSTIRRCGDSQCIFYMEVGRQSVIGAGEILMETDDALTALNMHRTILSAMLYKNDGSEQMRQRSSSATEASKPVNVLYKRQTTQHQQQQQQIDNRINNSPQTNSYYRRDRSDSLPTRNRTSSECSNQSFTTTLTSTTTPTINALPNIRTNVQTGHRPYQYQRHSNSPPMGCSESEESSISIDEPDDAGSLIPYRFNSRSSDGVIPEENTDELANCERKWSDANKDENNDEFPEEYIAMGPVNNSIDTVDGNKYTKHVPSSLCSLNHATSTMSGFDFPEYQPDATKCITNDIDSQCSRPARAYSVGNRLEHNKLKKHIINNTTDFDQSTTRARAFSVGSRAKIPRCDLRERGILFPKATINEPNFITNNNVSSVTDVSTGYNHLLNITNNREKKSTSAPLLLHKSQNSVDRMSDLMEIDFSSGSNNAINSSHQLSSANTSTSTLQQYSTNKLHLMKNIYAREQMKTSLSTINSSDNNIYPITNNITAFTTTNNSNSNINTITNTYPTSAPLPIKNIAQTDNGYLEMKPIGTSFSQHSPTNHTTMKLNNIKLNSTSNEYLVNKPKMINISNSNNAINNTNNGGGGSSNGGGNVDYYENKHQHHHISNFDIQAKNNENNLLKHHTLNNQAQQQQQQQQQQQHQQQQQQRLIKTNDEKIDQDLKNNFLNKYADIENNTTPIATTPTSTTAPTTPTSINYSIPILLTKKCEALTLNEVQNTAVATTAAVDINDDDEQKDINNINVNTLTIPTTTQTPVPTATTTVSINNSLNRLPSMIEVNNDDAGYEILQIKNDAITQQWNKNNVANQRNLSQQQQQQQQQHYNNRPKKTTTATIQAANIINSNNSDGGGGIAGGGGGGSGGSGINNLQIYPTSPKQMINASKEPKSFTFNKINNTPSKIQQSTTTTPILLNTIATATTTTSPSSSSSSPSTAATSSSTSSPSSLAINVSNANAAVNTTITSTTTTPSLPPSTPSATTTIVTTTTTPPLINTTIEHKLYYASLDLPPCTSTSIENVKNSKIDNLNESSSSSSSSPNNNISTNSYAKIDFEHSDSSSTSSKNYNV